MEMQPLSSTDTTQPIRYKIITGRMPMVAFDSIFKNNLYIVEQSNILLSLSLLMIER
jgi:hypothetical protein